jgi:ferredoxin
MAIEIDKTKCDGCGLCIDACALEALAALSLIDGMLVVDSELCVECGTCIDVCQPDAIFFPLDWAQAESDL